MHVARRRAVDYSSIVACLHFGTLEARTQAHLLSVSLTRRRDDFFSRLNRVVPRRSRVAVSGLVWSCLPRDETPTNALVWRAVAPRYAQTPSRRFAADLRHIYDSLYTADPRQVEILKFELSPRDVRLTLEWPLFPGS